LLVPLFFVSAYVGFLPAARCFISAAVVTAASVIAVPGAVKKPADCSAARPTTVMNRVSAPRDVRIIVLVSANIVSA
jgi:hypothetical protein